MFPKPISWLDIEKVTLTHQEHIFTNQKKCTTTQNKHKKLKPGFVTSYDIQPENGECLFRFWHLINLSLTYPLTYSPRTHMGWKFTWTWFTSGLYDVQQVVLKCDFFQDKIMKADTMNITYRIIFFGKGSSILWTHTPRPFL